MSEATAATDAELPTAEVRSLWPVAKPAGCSSEWWQYFSVYTLLRMAGVAVCNLCRAEVPRGGSSSTSGLRAHIVNQHPEYYEDNVLRKLKAKPGAMDRYTVSNPDFIDCFLKWLVMTRQPLSVAENPYFQRMLASLSSKVNVPSRTTITTKLIELQLQIQEAIKLLVMGLFVACTTDAWTSVANITYCSLTLHFITSNWQLVCLSLDCCSFPGSHTGERVAAKLNELLASYGIAKDHVMACVTDTASNMKKSARFMEYDWMGCMAHQLELVTGLAFEGVGVKEAVQQARALVGSIKGSSQHAQHVKEALIRLNMIVLAVIQDVTTRWWSTWSMIARLLQLKRALQSLHRDELLDIGLTEAQWTILAMLEKVLRPFMQVQKALEGDKYVSLSLVPYLLSTLRANLQAVATPESAVKQIATQMLTEFNQRFGSGEVETLPAKMVLAAALDPRTKALIGIRPAQHDMVHAELRLALLASADVYSEEAAAATATAAAAAAATMHADTEEEPDLFAALSAGVTAPAAAVLPEARTAQIDLELKTFRELPPLVKTRAVVDGETVVEWDPLKWWSQHCRMLPLLSALARKVLCIPATSASSERVFSSAGLTVTSLRNRLTESQAGRLVFLAGSWETVSQLSRAAAAAAAGADAAGGSSAGGGSSARGATATPGNASSRSESAPVRSVADQRAALDVAAAALLEGTHAAPWSNGGSGMGEGVPRKRKRSKANSSRGSGSNTTAAAARCRNAKPTNITQKGQKLVQGGRGKGKGKGKQQMKLTFREASSGSDASDDSNVSGVSAAVTRKHTSKPKYAEFESSDSDSGVDHDDSASDSSGVEVVDNDAEQSTEAENSNDVDECS